MPVYREYSSPLGRILLEAEGNVLTGLWLPGQRREAMPGETGGESAVLDETARWLDAYFQGDFREVCVPMKPRGTKFQELVWEILQTIPLGTTRSYGQIAREIAGKLGKEKMSAQAVGQAVGRNPISILIPCHRVVGAGGQLTGYAGGIEKKVWLLDHEGGTYDHQ